MGLIFSATDYVSELLNNSMVKMGTEEKKCPDDERDKKMS